MEPADLLPVVFGLHLEAHLLAAMARIETAAPEAPTLRAGLQRRCLLNAALNLERDRRVRKLFAVLSAANIPVMILKGTALRARYPELAGRPQCDTDFMVEKADVFRAEAVILDQGYQLDQSRYTREQYLAEHFHLKFLQDGHAIELHWTMSNHSTADAMENIWNRAEDLQWGGVRVKMPALADQVAFHHVHISRHLFMHALRWFADLFFELDRWPDLDPYPQTVRQEWPARYLQAPLRVASRHGGRLPSAAVAGSALGSPADRGLLDSLAAWHLQAKDWHRIPIWYYESGFRRWLESGEGSLIAAIGGSVVRRLLLRPLIAAGLARRPLDLDEA